jgi:ribosomal protein S18 acetylase RimI-like enzyme
MSGSDAASVTIHSGMTVAEFSEVAGVLSDAFADYPLAMTFTPDTLAGMCRADDLRLDTCALARASDGRLLGVGLGGLRGGCGRLAAMGVTRAAHRRGLGQGLGQAVLDALRRAGADRVVLEALTVNRGALALYEGRLGFKRLRRLVGFTRAAGGEPIPPLAWEQALGSGDEPDSWQLAHVVARARRAADPVFVPAVVPERHPIARLLRDAGFAEAEIDQYELARSV